MLVYPFLKVSFFMNAIAVLWVICALMLILIILIQKGKGGGLSGAFGGGIASGIMGSKTGDFLTWVTIVLVGVFLLFSIVLAKFYRPSAGSISAAEPVRQSQPVEPEQPVIPEQASPAVAETNSPGD